MRINFVGPWGRMKHYHFSDIYNAAPDQDEWSLWQEEMKGKIVLISNTYTGSTDVGRIPVDSAYPLSGVHANVVHTILKEDFIWDIYGYRSLLIQILSAAMLFVLFLRYPSIPFSVSALVLAAAYFAAAVASLVFLNVLLPVAKPLLLLLIAWSGLFSLKSIQNAFEQMRIQKAKEIAERELEIGRKIQADFLPSEHPSIPGWQIETRFKPAYQVSGDFYDVFELSGGKYHAIVMGDVCDHGVGSALFMAVVRSMVRIFSLQSSNTPQTSPEKLILETVNRTNNYIAENHGDTGMFATMFIGFLNSESGELFYVNCGHEPPPVIRNGEIKQFLKATGLAVGVMEDSAYTCRKVTMERGDYIFLYTDGITDALDHEGNAFSKNRLLKIVSGNRDGLRSMLNRLQDSFVEHVSDGKVTDDVTYMAVKNGVD
jgi:serine phosphatase RsbU (regulator of sigma subunit)